MKLKKHGKNTSKAEIAGITPHGLWLHIDSNEYFLPFSEYPWFKEAKLSEIQEVEFVKNKYLRWAAIDVDLELESLNNLEKYPLKFHS